MLRTEEPRCFYPVTSRARLSGTRGAGGSPANLGGSQRFTRVSPQRLGGPGSGGVNGTAFPEGGLVTGIKDIKTRLLFDPEIPALGMCAKDSDQRRQPICRFKDVLCC